MRLCLTRAWEPHWGKDTRASFSGSWGPWLEESPPGVRKVGVCGAFVWRVQTDVRSIKGASVL